MHTLKLRQIGNSVGVILPREVLTQLKVEEGDTLFLTATPEGYVVTPYDPTFEAQLKVARAAMKKRRRALHRLAR